MYFMFSVSFCGDTNKTFPKQNSFLGLAVCMPIILSRQFCTQDGSYRTMRGRFASASIQVFLYAMARPKPDQHAIPFITRRRDRCIDAECCCWCSAHINRIVLTHLQQSANTALEPAKTWCSFKTVYASLLTFTLPTSWVLSNCLLHVPSSFMRMRDVVCLRGFCCCSGRTHK